MVDFAVLPGFIAVILMFLIPPGPDMAYMLAVGLEGGRQAALKAILGIGTGMSIYAAAVAIGMGRIAQSHPMALDAVRVLGAAYLMWLAFMTLRNARHTVSGPSDIRASRWYLRGVFVSLTNPKLILFFLAVLPQFIGRAENSGLQMAMLGAIDVAMEVALYGWIGVSAGKFRVRLMCTKNATTVLNYIACVVYFVLAAAIATEVLLVKPPLADSIDACADAHSRIAMACQFHSPNKDGHH